MLKLENCEKQQSSDKIATISVYKDVLPYKISLSSVWSVALDISIIYHEDEENKREIQSVNISVSSGFLEDDDTWDVNGPEGCSIRWTVEQLVKKDFASQTYEERQSLIDAIVKEIDTYLELEDITGAF